MPPYLPSSRGPISGGTALSSANSATNSFESASTSVSDAQESNAHEANPATSPSGSIPPTPQNSTPTVVSSHTWLPPVGLPSPYNSWLPFTAVSQPTPPLPSETSLSPTTSLPPSTSPSLAQASQTSAAPRHHNVGAIAGGSVGGFVVLTLLILIAFLLLARRRRQRIAPSAAYRAAYGTTPPPICSRSVLPSHFLPSHDNSSVSNTRNTVFDGHRSSVPF